MSEIPGELTIFLWLTKNWLNCVKASLVYFFGHLVLLFQLGLILRDVRFFRQLKERTQEVRRLRADVANAKLQADKTASERDALAKTAEASRSDQDALKAEVDRLLQQVEELSAIRSLYVKARDDLDAKESEIEAKHTEIRVMQETIATITSGPRTSANNLQKAAKAATASKPDAIKESRPASSSDGWDCEDDFTGFGGADVAEDADDGDDGGQVQGQGLGEDGVALVPVDLDIVREMCRLRVDLEKAQGACETLSSQLTDLEVERDSAKVKLEEVGEDLGAARKARDEAVKDRVELENKHQVLAAYFNQREAELQKQLGMQTVRLGDAEMGSESSSRQLALLNQELDSYKDQVKTLKLEMEEQV